MSNSRGHLPKTSHLPRLTHIRPISALTKKRVDGTELTYRLWVSVYLLVPSSAPNSVASNSTLGIARMVSVGRGR